MQFKCAFIYLTGMKPNKSDMQVIQRYVQESSKTEEFTIGWEEFEKIMGLYLQ